MSNQPNGPRDVVEGGPERPPDGDDEPEQASGRPKKDEQKKEAPARQGDVPPWYQPESGQPGTSR